MKKIFALLVVAFIALNASAQAPATDSWKPQQGNIGFTFGLSGLANIGVNANTIPTGTLLFRYYIANDMAIRVGINVSTSSNTGEKIDSISGGGEKGTNDTKVVTKGSSWGINLGIQKSFGDNNKLEPYVGADLWIGGGKSGKIDSTGTVVGSGAGSSYNSVTEMTTAPGSTFTFGITPLVGFNWFIGKQFAIGAEFGWGLFISSTPAGTVTSVTTGTSTTGGVVTQNGNNGTYTSNTASSKGTALGTHGTGMVTCSVFFNP